jgi:hypothetical protein
MSAALDLMKSLTADGVEFSTDGVRIRWRNGDGRVTPDVVATLAAEKATVIDFLSGKNVPAGVPASPDPEDLRTAFEERAAILEYDAGLSREEAERQATAEVYGSGRVVISSISETGAGKTAESLLHPPYGGCRVRSCFPPVRSRDLCRSATHSRPSELRHGDACSWLGRDAGRTG